MNCTLAEDMLIQINNVQLDSGKQSKVRQNFIQSLDWNSKSEKKTMCEVFFY